MSEQPPPDAPPPGVGPEAKVESIRVLWDTEPVAVSADFAVAAARPFGQFALILCAVSPDDPARNAEGKMEATARIVSSVRLSAGVFRSLIEVMTTVWNNFAKAQSVDTTGHGEEKTNG